MSDRDWERELAKIDQQMKSLPDDRLLPARAPAASAPVGRQDAAPAPAAVKTSTLGVMTRLVLAISLGVGILFWPYEARCGLGLAGYLAAVGAVAVSGVWSGIWSWRHRAGRAHVLSLLLVLWGLVLGAIEVLPRTGLVTRTGAAPVSWVCR